MVAMQTRDADIRRAMHKKRLKRYKKQPKTLVINELGLARAKGRIDIAIINGSIHGFEIKSDCDTLDRLDKQISLYRKTLQKLTIVSAPKHIEEIKRRVPDWCGILMAKQGSRGGINFQLIQRPRTNPDVDTFTVAQLLWRDEVIKFLEDAGYNPKYLKGTKSELYRLLCKSTSIDKMIGVIYKFMSEREGWPSPSQQHE